jgi:alpha-glucosidase (family GH31 glycosyl hydrolase)
MFVAPILTPADPNTQMAEKTVWIPPGQWFEEEAGALLNGGASGGLSITKKYDLTEIPIFVRAGAVIARLPDLTGRTIGVASKPVTIIMS